MISNGKSALNEPQKAVIYARVSTLLGQDPQHQIMPCAQLCSSRGFHLSGQYVDYVSGASERRKELDKLIKDARMGKFKIVVIYALDRLARDVRFLLNLLHELDGYGVSVISIRESIDLSTPIGKALTQILGSIAELEKNLISERIKTALDVKKANAAKTGWRCGRPSKITPELIDAVTKLYNSGSSLRQIATALNVSKSTILRVLQMGPKTSSKKDG